MCQSQGGGVQRFLEGKLQRHAAKVMIFVVLGSPRRHPGRPREWLIVDMARWQELSMSAIIGFLERSQIRDWLES
jgi:hypothetical protein